MSYYCYITGLYKSYLPQLNRTLRSSSVPRHVQDIDRSSYSRSVSVPPVDPLRYSATPFHDRSTSVPPPRRSVLTTSWMSDPSYHRDEGTQVTDLRAAAYMDNLVREDSIKHYVSNSRHTNESRGRERFSSRYDFYDGVKHGRDYLYPVTSDLLGSWKHFHVSGETLSARNARAKSPILSRELNRYISPQYIQDRRHYNYRQVPYFGGSDDYRNLRSNSVFGRKYI